MFSESFFALRKGTLVSFCVWDTSRQAKSFITAKLFKYAPKTSRWTSYFVSCVKSSGESATPWSNDGILRSQLQKQPSPPLHRPSFSSVILKYRTRTGSAFGSLYTFHKNISFNATAASSSFYCKLSPLSERHYSTQDKSGSGADITISGSLSTRESVNEFLANLSSEQKTLLYHSLNIDVLRDKFEDHLGSSKLESHHYLSKYGRPAIETEDPTGTLCEVPPKWLKARIGPNGDNQNESQQPANFVDAKSTTPAASAIWAVGVKNALPFIGFGFLDNLIMILAGDYIDITIGTTLGISTMAAAALGNTISDVAGIGSAWYVEELANKVGIKDPDLTPSQFASWAIRWASNLGRAIGVIIGCLLGMFPLIFLASSDDDEKKADTGEKSKSKT